MTPEQKEEWLAAARCKLDGGEVEFWDSEMLSWVSTIDGNDVQWLKVRYRPKPAPQQFYVAWNGAVTAGCALKRMPNDAWDSIIKISIDDLIKHGERIK